MLQNSTKVTGDNKGVAAIMMEKALASDDSAAEGFVAGFSQSNVGDTTPNTLGAWLVHHISVQNRVLTAFKV